MICNSCFAEVDNKKNTTNCSNCDKVLHLECAIHDQGYFCDVCYGEKDLEQHVASKKVELPHIIRRSHIEQYKKCPHSFLLSLKEGVLKHNNEDSEEELRNSAHAQIGVDLHNLFDMFFKKELFSKDQMVAGFLSIWDGYSVELFKSDEEKDTLYTRAMNCIDTFFTIAPHLPTPVAHEENIIFTIAEDMPQVSITMDMVYESSDGLNLVDWKTGRVMTGKKFTTDLQAPLYIYAIQQKYKKPVKSFTFYYLDENKIRTFERVDDDKYVCRVLKKEYFISITEAIREVKSLFGRMKNGDFNIPRDTKRMFFTCKMCEHRISGKCAGADEQGWYNNAEEMGWNT